LDCSDQTLLLVCRVAPIPSRQSGIWSATCGRHARCCKPRCPASGKTPSSDPRPSAALWTGSLHAQPASRVQRHEAQDVLRERRSTGAGCARVHVCFSPLGHRRPPPGRRRARACRAHTRAAAVVGTEAAASAAPVAACAACFHRQGSGGVAPRRPPWERRRLSPPPPCALWWEPLNLAARHRYRGDGGQHRRPALPRQGWEARQRVQWQTSVPTLRGRASSLGVNTRHCGGC